MIYSRFGTRLVLVSRQQDSSGAVSLQATVEGSTGIRQVRVGDLTADGGSAEIEVTVAKLPWRVFEKKEKRF